MITTLQIYIDALRNELQQYGEMLALLESRDEWNFKQSSGSLLRCAQEIEAQIATIDTARAQRTSSEMQLAWALGSPDRESVQQIVASVPEEYRPLVTALGEEIRELILRLQESAEINRSQLHRSMELMQRFSAGISPQAEPAPFSPKPDSPGADSGPLVAATI